MYNCMASLGGHLFVHPKGSKVLTSTILLQRAGPLAYRVNSHLSGCQTTDKRENTAEKGGAWDKATL